MGLLSSLVKDFIQILRFFGFDSNTENDIPTPPPIVQPPTIPLPAPVLSAPTIEDFAITIRDYEGQPGDLNYRNNNPGNFRCSAVGYDPKYGAVKCVNNFAVFPTYELGWQYMLAIIRERAEKHPTWTIKDFINNYSPTSDGNDPQRYAETIARRLAVEPSFLVSHLT